MDKFVAFDLLLAEGCLPLVGSRTIASVRSVATGNGSRSNVGLYDWAWSWDSDLVLNRLALLVRDPLGDHFAVSLLNVLASGNRLLSGSLLGSVGADLLGHLTAVRLDSHLAGGLGNSLNLDCWSSMNSSTIASIDSSAMGNSSE